jgi:hypothetical protein
MLTGLALAYALGLGLSAVQLLPAMALSAQGQRSDIGSRWRRRKNISAVCCGLSFLRSAASSG